MSGAWNDIYTGRRWSLPFRSSFARELDHRVTARSQDRFEESRRFGSLQDAARERIGRLGSEYLVTRTDGADLSPFTAAEWPGTMSTRLEPAPAAAPVTFLFGSGAFPGVDLQYGFAGRSRLPGCFCDQCAESVEENIERMSDVVASVVAGQFAEARVRRRLGHDVYRNHRYWRDLSESREEQLDPSLRDLMPRGDVTWRPWVPSPRTAS